MKKVLSDKHEELQVFSFGFRPFGEPTMLVNIFFVDGLLIDTGQVHMRKEVVKSVKGLPVDQVFLTHYHEDHSGNIGPIQDLFEVPSYAPPLTVELMKDPPWVSPAQRITWGKPEANFKLEPKKESISSSKFHFELIPIPGHAADMVGLYEKNKGWLFSADLYVHHYIRYFKREEVMAQQIASLKKLLALDFEFLFCSHSGQVSNGKEKLKRKLQFFENFYGQVHLLQEKGYSIKRIMKAMKLKENPLIKLMSLGELSTQNMVRSALKD